MFSARRIVGPSLALAIVLAACTSAPAATPRPTATTAAATPVGSVAPSGSASPVAAETYPLSIATAADVGDYLTGIDGMTLYVLIKDGANSSTCDGSCATTWPPYTLEAGEEITAGEGVSGTIATFVRADGTTQVSYNGQPLYYYSGDDVAGDTKGEGIGGVWFVAPATGKASPAPATGSANY